MGRLLDWLRGDQGTIQQAWTITPDAADLGDVAAAEHDAAGIFQVTAPSPAHIEAVSLICEELSDVMKVIRQEVWREGVVVESTFQGQCTECMRLVDDTGVDCPYCNAPRDAIREPDIDGRKVLEEKAKRVNQDGESLLKLGQQLTEDANKHGRGYVVYQYRRQLDERGVIIGKTLSELRRASPWNMVALQHEARGRRGGAYVCLKCRNDPKYKPETMRKPCSTCGSVVYEAWWRQEVGESTTYFLPDEVHEVKWHYPDGSSPITRLWVKILTLLWMDRYAFYAFDPNRGKAPGKTLVTWGGDGKSIKSWADRDAEKRKKNPYRLSHIHLPSSGGPIQDKDGLGATVLDVGDEEIKKQSPELYERHLQAIRRTYGVSPLRAGDASTSGGLNNESQQLRVEAQQAQAVQKAHLEWMNLAAKRWGIHEWQYDFPDLIEEDEVMEASAVKEQLEVARLAKDQGLEVRWEKGQAVISDGEVKEVKNDPIPFPSFQQAAPRTDDSQIQGVRSAFRGPAAGAQAADVAHPVYEGLTASQSAEVNGEIVEAMTQPQGWSVKSIQERIQPLLERAGIEEASRRAEVIARTESAAMQSEFKDRWLAELEERRGEPVKVRMIGASDARTTKLSVWLRQQSEEGVTRNRLKALIDEGISLAQQGVFEEGGALGTVPGRPIRLPAGFRRRGFVAHFGDRDDVVTVR